MLRTESEHQSANQTEFSATPSALRNGLYSEEAADEMLGLYRKMFLIRTFEEACSEHYAKVNIRGFLHLYIGQEATGVGVISALRPEDYIVTHYRDHGHALARGLDTNRTMAELFGKRTGLSKGKGGSMHLFDAALRFLGGHAIVGGHFPLAAGTALAQQYKKEEGITVVFFGDGSANQGTYHETMNLAGLWRLPILFVMENNGYGMGSSVERVHAGTQEFYEGASYYGIDGVQVDGMDVLAVKKATVEATQKIRGSSGPYFLEVKTYRFQGHSLADGQKYRSREEVERRRGLDPIVTFARSLTVQGFANKDKLEAIEAEVRQEVEDAVDFSLRSPNPDPSELHDDVLA